MEDDTSYGPPSTKPIETEAISYRKILMTAKGMFVKVYVTENKSIHGYISSIMNDYFIFYSPAYKAMFVSMDHLKYLIPYPPITTPYSLDNLPLNPPPSPSVRKYMKIILI